MRKGTDMTEKNNFRKIYMVYSIVIGELFAAAIIICAGYIPNEILQQVVRYLGIIAVILVPVIMFVFYRWRIKDNASSSDELEQLLLTKAFAAAGLVAVSLLPVLLLTVCIFQNAAGHIVFGYAVIIGGTLKLSTYFYNRKF